MSVFYHEKLTVKQFQAILVTLYLLKSGVVTDWSGFIIGDAFHMGLIDYMYVDGCDWWFLYFYKTQWSNITGGFSGLLMLLPPHCASGSRGVEWILFLEW